MGRNGGGAGYSRNREYPQNNGFAEQNTRMNRNGGGGSSDGSSRGQNAVDHPMKENSNDVNGMISGLEKKVAGVTQDFTQAIHKISEKENEKFDLIFAILSELQTRQAHLEESVRSLKSQFGGSQPQQMMQQPQQMMQQQQQMQQQQMNGQMCAQMNGNMGGNQQPMQQTFMQPDGSQMMMQQVMQPQQMMIMSPPNNGGMQCIAVPQMMTPQGAIVQQMPQQMAMQFIAHNGQQDMNGGFSPVQDACQGQAQVGSLQAEMNMIKADNTGNGAWQGGNAPSDQTQQEGAEGQGQNGVTSETSSQEGKIDDSCPAPNSPTVA